MQTIKTPWECFITQSFRFGQGIADMANSILHSYMHPNLRPPLIKGFQEKESTVVYESLPYNEIDVIICRTNGGVISQVFTCLEQNIPIYVQGGVNQMISLLKGAEDLQSGKRTYVPDLALFRTWNEVVEYSESESGRDMKSLINLINIHGIQKLINALYNTCQNKNQAKITLTTAHKSKGLEWNNVKLHDDFNLPEIGQKMPQEEINILYVSATRALNVLDVSNCLACHKEIMEIHEGYTHE